MPAGGMCHVESGRAVSILGGARRRVRDGTCRGRAGRERRIVELAAVVGIIFGLIALGLLALRFGADSRDGIEQPRQEPLQRLG